MKEKVLDFWFKELRPKDWFMKSDEMDQRIKNQFLETFHQVARGEMFSWRETIEGRLAEIIVLDQFSRNMFRGDARSFQYDFLALTLSQEARLQPEVNNLSNSMKAFLFMPFMHSESLVIHEEAIKIFAEPGLEQNLEFEIKHKVILEKFGRYPHRNDILGRESTDEEIEFLKGPGSSF